MSPPAESPSLLSVHRFSLRPLPPPSDSLVHALAISFGQGQAVNLWILDQEGQADQLAASFPNLPEGTGTKSESILSNSPLSTLSMYNSFSPVLGSPGSPDDPSLRLASQLSRQLGKPVFVGFNCGGELAAEKALTGILKGILKEAKNNPKHF